LVITTSICKKNKGEKVVNKLQWNTHNNL
jgi:hypothetical protein